MSNEVGPGGGYPGINGLPVSTGDSPHNRLANAVRRITAATVGRPLSEEALAEAAEGLTRIADAMEASGGSAKRPRGTGPLLPHPQDFFSISPMFGYANPIAPPAEVWCVEAPEGQAELRGRVTFDYQYEGPPTCVHGGVIAELFDEMLGAVNIVSGRPGVTGTLTVRYRKPTPLLAQLDLVSRTTRFEGRKIFAWGGIYHQGVLTAEAEGVFIAVNPERMMEIAEINSRNASVPVIDPDRSEFSADRS